MTPEAKQTLLANFETQLSALFKAIDEVLPLPRLEAEAYNHMTQVIANNKQYPPKGDDARLEHALQSTSQTSAELVWMEQVFRASQARKALLQAMETAKALAAEASNAIEEVRKTEYSTRDEFTQSAKRLIVVQDGLRARAKYRALSGLDTMKPRADMDEVLERRFEIARHNITHEWVYPKKA
jgi:uncharacterized membrane protein